MSKTRQIAIVHLIGGYNNYDDYEEIIKSVTEWREVSEETFRTLDIYCKSTAYTGGTNLKLLERLDICDFSFQGILSKAKEYERKQEEAEAKRKLAAEKRKQAAALKKKQEEINNKEIEIQLLKELQEKYKDQV